MRTHIAGFIEADSSDSDFPLREISSLRHRTIEELVGNPPTLCNA